MKRNYGVDLLRIISMIMIVTLHVMGHGGVLDASRQHVAGYGIAWLLEIVAYCAVNCYALISGYVGYGSKHKYMNIVLLYLQVVFWILVVQTVFAVIMPGSVGLKDYIKAFLPFAVNTYWYFSAYFCMFFFIPFINCLIENLDRKQANNLMISIVTVFSLLPTIFQNDMFKMSYGSSAYWLAMLYIIGAYIRKFEIGDGEHSKRYMLLYVSCVFVTWLSQFGVEILLGNILSGSEYNSPLVSYVSPTILLAAIGLLVFFKNISTGAFMKKVIAFFAPVSFGVYLIHDAPLVRRFVISGRFAQYGSYSPVRLVLSVLGAVCAIWLICSILDYCRLTLFKVFKIKEICFKMQEKIYGIVCKGKR